ncbi:hypothetical protein [Helicobacter mesocricetorum]|uniref:hypothetical protein n=1 Tax=Helicobacter mesocricetorum TaxID=87012 RepID=UPI000CF0BE95|nr:hypothetical protein [Helicobacter mesocricetorum]
MQPTNNVINIRGGGQKGENMQSHNKTSKNISTLNPSNSYTMDSMNNKLSYTCLLYILEHDDEESSVDTELCRT